MAQTERSKSKQTTAHPGSKRRLRLWFAFVGIFSAWAIYTFLIQHEHHGETSLRLAEIERKLADGQAISDELQLQIRRLDDPEYIQEVDRKEQGMIVPGEKPIRVTERSE